LENSVEENGGWNSSLQTIYDGIALGETTVNELQNAVDAINVTSTSAAETVFYWYHELSKFGVGINATTIKAALNEAAMLPNVGGLPDDYDNINVSPSVPSFLVYFRYDLYAYQWAAQLNYETSKWNISQAYTVFNNAVTENGEPVLCVGSNGKGWEIGYGPRYYDECAETIDMYIIFWQLGIPGALAQAEDWWNWANSNLWEIDSSTGTGYYEYALQWNTFECETGGFDQIIWDLYNCDPSISNVGNLLTDLSTRFLSQGWNSPQWNDYVVQHAADNSQERLENTIMAWSSLLGFYNDMTGPMQGQVQALLDGEAGPAPAWSLMLSSELYDNSTGMFRMLSNYSPSVESTADAAVLMVLLSTVPLNGSVAVPMDDTVYEDTNNVIDGGISNVNITNRTVTVSVGEPGTFMSMFGTNIFQYDLNSTGVWQLTFASDWNSIANETLVSPLPTSRMYLGQILNQTTYAISASSGDNCIMSPSGLVLVANGDNQTFTYSAADGYTIYQVLVDNVSVPITGSYTFTNVQESHNITVVGSILETPSPTPTPTPTAMMLPPPTPYTPPTAPPTSNPHPEATPTASPTPTQNPSASPVPTPSASPSNRSSPSASIRLTYILGASAFVAVLMVASLALSLYSKKHRKSSKTPSPCKSKHPETEQPTRQLAPKKRGNPLWVMKTLKSYNSHQNARSLSCHQTLTSLKFKATTTKKKCSSSSRTTET
jgi:hypothetical protein